MWKRVRDAELWGTFVRSAFTSVLATLTDFVVASFLAWRSAPPSVATLVGCVAGGVVAFSLNRGWAFRSAGRPGREVARFVFVWAMSAALNSLGVGLLTHYGLGFGLGWAIVRGTVYSGWNYPMLRWFVFATKSDKVVA